LFKLNTHCDLFSMNLNLPYERLGVSDRINHIPLKLALHESDEKSLAEVATTNPPETVTNDFVSQVADGVQYFNFNVNVLSMLGVWVLVIMFALAIVYMVYYFIILRERQTPAPRQQSQPRFV
jgi:Orf78 (ac78)